MIYFLDEDILLEDFSCEGTELFPVFQTAKFAIRLIQIAVPFALIIWGSLDWFKALIAHDEKEMRIKRKPFIARVIAAMIVLILPMLLQKISEGLAGTNEFWTCYSEAKPRLNFKGMEIEGWDKGESSPDLPNNNYEIIGGGGSITNEMNDISDEISEEIDSIESKANEAKEAVQKYCSEYAVDECKTTDFYGYKCHVSVDGTKCVPLEEYEKQVDDLKGQNQSGKQTKPCHEYSVKKCPSTCKSGAKFNQNKCLTIDEYNALEQAAKNKENQNVNKE